MTDRFTVRAVVIGLFVLGLAFGAGIIYLSATNHDHGVLDNLTAVVVGALAGVLSRTNTEVQPVAVVGQPVATTEVDAPPSTRRRSKDRGEGLVVALVVILLVAIIVGFIIR